jgi:hypothetical protein
VAAGDEEALVVFFFAIANCQAGMLAFAGGAPLLNGELRFSVDA